MPEHLSAETTGPADGPSIVSVGHPVLRQQAQALKPHEIRSRPVQNLIETMMKTMRAAPGVGLAAPQIGVALQLAVIEDRHEYISDLDTRFVQERERHPVDFHVIANPKLTILGDNHAEFFEGCLSLPGFTAVVPRALKVRVECLDQNGAPRTIEAQGWYARILQHEIDHLEGRLYIDRMVTRTFSSSANYN